jgi:hypothetical protein
MAYDVVSGVCHTPLHILRLKGDIFVTAGKRSATYGINGESLAELSEHVWKL